MSRADRYHILFERLASNVQRGEDPYRFICGRGDIPMARDVIQELEKGSGKAEKKISMLIPHEEGVRYRIFDRREWVFLDEHDHSLAEAS